MVAIEFDSQLKEKEKRMPGSAKGKIFLSDDFEQPLDDATIKLFYHDSWKSLFDSLNEFSDDFMAEREQPKEQTREFIRIPGLKVIN